jgi:hypothetical protein
MRTARSTTSWESFEDFFILAPLSIEGHRNQLGLEA